MATAWVERAQQSLVGCVHHWIMEPPNTSGYVVSTCKKCGDRKREPLWGEDSLNKPRGYALLNTRKTHCPRGHEYNDANTRLTVKGWRQCKECRRAQTRRYKRLARSLRCAFCNHTYVEHRSCVADSDSISCPHGLKRHKVECRRCKCGDFRSMETR